MKLFTKGWVSYIDRKEGRLSWNEAGVPNFHVSWKKRKFFYICLWKHWIEGTWQVTKRPEQKEK